MSLEDLAPEERRAHALGKLLLNTNPEIKLEAQRLAKKANPALNIPELEIEERVNARVGESDKKVEKLEGELMAERVARRQAARNAEIEKRGLSVEEVEKIIVAEGCSYETAMKMAELQRQTATPTAGDYQGGNPPGTHVEMRPGEDWRKLSGGALRRKSADVANEVIKEFRQGRPGAR